MADHALTARAPFSGFAVPPSSASPGSSAGGVTATDCDGRGLATVALKKAQSAALIERVRERYGIDLPLGSSRRESRGIAFAGLGPETWLATRDNGADDFFAALARDIGALASVTDQSAGYAVLRLAGPKLRDTLAKLLPLDLHPRAFKPGDVVSTLTFHMGATLWRLEDNPDGTPVFEIAVFRSLASSFWHALSESAAEFGLVVTPQNPG
jgi:heterotetrameric sarcosine oxidase gamma subunit